MVVCRKSLPSGVGVGGSIVRLHDTGVVTVTDLMESDSVSASSVVTSTVALTTMTPVVEEVVVWCDDFKDKKRRLFALLSDAKKFHPPAIILVDSVDGANMFSTTIRKCA